jgi:hypothetical protein
LNTRGHPTFPAIIFTLTGIFPAAAFGSVDRAAAQHDKDVIQMNEVHRCASAWVQRGALKVASKINEPGHPTGHLGIPF